MDLYAELLFLACFIFFVSGLLSYYFAVRTATRNPELASLRQEVACGRRRKKTEEDATEQLLSKIGDVDHFTYVVSHDLRQPLRTIASFVQLLERDLAVDRKDRINDFIGRVLAASKRMNDLLEGLLTYSQSARTGALDEVVVLGDVLSNVVDDLAHITRGVRFELSTPRGLPSVRGSYLLYYQLFLNLVTNSVKFRRPGRECRVIIDYKEFASHYKFQVIDNGKGVETGKTGRLFEPFQRLSYDTAGSGIGLAVCKRAAISLGGDIWMESKGANQGCTFYFTAKKRPNDKKNTTGRGR